MVKQGHRLGMHDEITLAFLHLLGNNNAPCHVVDVGMNSGWFSLVASAHGCKVTAFEIQEKFQLLIR